MTPDSVARLAEVLAERDERLLAAYVQDEAAVSDRRLRDQLAAQTKRALVHPVFFGSAITGAGVDALMAGLTELLPVAAGDADGPVSGSVFKIERDGGGEKIAYVRMFSGTVHARDRLRFGADLADKVTSVAVFEPGAAVPRPSVSVGEIGKLRGLGQIRIGDRIGQIGTDGAPHQFPAPTLESVVVARDPADRARLRVALDQLAEQDPLINLRQDDTRQEIYVSLYGEVQKEIIQATLANDFDLDITFRETTMIYIERPAGRGSAVEFLQADTHPFSATVGLRIEPGPAESGIRFRLGVDPGQVPIYIYKTTDNFIQAMTQYVHDALQTGLSGWRVTDCIVTMTECGYYVGDGPGKRLLSTPRTTAADFRKLTPLVLARALRQAGTIVCEPMARLSLEVPVPKMGAVLAVLARLGASVAPPSLRGELVVVGTLIPAAQVHGLQQQLPKLTGGEGVFESDFGGYRPVRG